MNRDTDRSDLARRELAGVANVACQNAPPFDCTELLCTMVDMKIVLRHLKISQVETCLKASMRCGNNGLEGD